MEERIIAKIFLLFILLVLIAKIYCTFILVTVGIMQSYLPFYFCEIYFYKNKNKKSPFCLFLDYFTWNL